MTVLSLSPIARELDGGPSECDGHTTARPMPKEATMKNLTPATTLLMRPEALKALREEAFAEAERKAAAIRREKAEARRIAREQGITPHLTQPVLNEQIVALLDPQ